MPKNVQMPDGSVIQFPDGMSDQEVSNAIQTQYRPGVPKAPTPAGLQGPPAPQSPAPKLGSFGDTIGNIGTHLKNMVMGPAHAVGDPADPSDPMEGGLSSLAGAIPGGSLLLPAYRLLAKPTVQGVSTAVQQAKAGNYGLKNEPEYDAQGNYRPTMVSGIADAIPIAGPWARSIENDAEQKGMLPALAGLGTDIAAPKVAGKTLGIVTKTAGKAAQVASATPESAKLAATRFLVPGKPGELLQSALKPGVKYGAGAADTLQSSIPDILNADPNVRGVGGFASAADAAKDASYQPYNSLTAKYRPAPGGIGPTMARATHTPTPGAVGPSGPFVPFPNETIYGGPIADAQQASIPAIDRFESQPAPPQSNLLPSDWTARNPMRPPIATGIVPRTADRASLYRRDIPVATADALREDANAKLNAFYNKAGGDQNAALSSPETARTKAIGDATRSQLYPKLEADAGLPSGTVAGMQQKYGQLSDVADIANKRKPVFARHDPVSLSQKIVGGHGNPLSMAWNYAVQKGLTKLTDSDALVNSAIDRFQNPENTPLPPRPGILPRAGSVVGGTLYGFGRAASKAPLAMNPLFYWAIHPPK